MSNLNGGISLDVDSSGQGQSGELGEDGDDQEDSSSSSHLVQPGNDALASFRAQWQKELESSPSYKHHLPTSETSLKSVQEEEEETIENRAKDLFLKGTEHEQSGKLYEAIQFYRRAVQLVPDIEFKLYESTKQRQHLDIPKIEDEEECIEEISNYDDEEEFDAEQTDLLSHLQRIVNRNGCVCIPRLDQIGTHISALPIEIILYILRWVVSSDLDLRSLEVCSCVCRGLYICSRDPEIWRLACIRIWGVNCGGLSKYSSWREMFIMRPRLHFNGCYISKTTYVRHGENNFQDQFYRPWHLVEYYRYLRFFPDGLVLMLTTPEEPLSCLSLLKHKYNRHPAVLVGRYRLHGDTVTLALHRQDPNISKFRSRRNNYNQEQTFHLELQILSYRSRIHAQLVWRGYSVFTKRQSGQETSTTFELAAAKFPPLWFSRVKSYTAEADTPLM